MGGFCFITPGTPLRHAIMSNSYMYNYVYNSYMYCMYMYDKAHITMLFSNLLCHSRKYQYQIKVEALAGNRFGSAEKLTKAKNTGVG